MIPHRTPMNKTNILFLIMIVIAQSQITFDHSKYIKEFNPPKKITKVKSKKNISPKSTQGFKKLETY